MEVVTSVGNELLLVGRFFYFISTYHLRKSLPKLVARNPPLTLASNFRCIRINLGNRF